MALENNKKLIVAARLNKLEGENGAPFLVNDIVRMANAQPDAGISLNYTEKPVFQTALYVACWKNNEFIAKLLMDKGADLNHPDTEGRTPLHEACYYGHKNIVTLLLDKGANINSMDNHGQTPLFRAVWAGKIEIVELLIERGADTNVADKDNATVFHQAAFVGDPVLAKWLYYKGAVRNQYDVGWIPKEAEKQEIKPYISPPIPEGAKDASWEVGTDIDFTLMIKHAHGLMDADVQGLSDPYAMMTIYTPEDKEREEDFKIFDTWKSKVVKDNLNPVWDETKVFELRGMFKTPEKIRIEIFDEDISVDEDATRHAIEHGFKDHDGTRQADDTLGFIEFDFPQYDQMKYEGTVTMQYHTEKGRGYKLLPELTFSYLSAHVKNH